MGYTLTKRIKLTILLMEPLELGNISSKNRDKPYHSEFVCEGEERVMSEYQRQKLEMLKLWLEFGVNSSIFLSCCLSGISENNSLKPAVAERRERYALFLFLAKMDVFYKR